MISHAINSNLVKEGCLDKIKELIEEVTQNCYDGYILNLPRLCENENVKVKFGKFKDTSIYGSIRIEPLDKKNKPKVEVHLNSEVHVVRQRFTLAHEIGHYISYLAQSHTYQEGVVVTEERGALASYGTDKKEIEANALAAEILMREEDIKDYFQNYPRFDIADIATEFGVSIQAMSIRLAKLDYVLLG
jgi:Zn-dependent peptidase ImmA (M78 family)